MKILKVLFILSVLSYSMIAFLTPFISQLWIGTYEEQFINYTYIILFSLAINTLAGAAYFINMGSGDVKYNTQSQIVIAILSIGLGILLGNEYAGIGVVWAYGIAIIIGSIWLIINFVKRNFYAQKI